MNELVTTIKKQYTPLVSDPGFNSALWECGCRIYRDDPFYCEKHAPHSRQILSPLNEKRIEHFAPIIAETISPDTTRKILLHELAKHAWHPDTCC